MSLPMWKRILHYIGPAGVCIIFLMALAGVLTDRSMRGVVTTVVSAAERSLGRYVLDFSTTSFVFGDVDRHSSEISEALYQAVRTDDWLVNLVGLSLLMRGGKPVYLEIRWGTWLLMLPFIVYLLLFALSVKWPAKCNSFLSSLLRRLESSQSRLGDSRELSPGANELVEFFFPLRRENPMEGFGLLDLEFVFAEYQMVGFRSRFLWFLKYASLFVPFFLPLAFHHLYQPINAEWTVKRFGCGCPGLDMLDRFDANDFNFYVWIGFWLTFSAVWIWRVEKILKPIPQDQRSLIGGAGILILLFFSMIWYLKGIWM